jgi:hypothetical protein
MTEGPKWTKASASLSGACVEVARFDGRIAVRDSKNPDGAILLYTDREWDAFLDGAKKGEFDHFLNG